MYRDEKLFLHDIKESVEAILSYTKDMRFEEFVNDRKTYSAVIREFEIIGEAIKHLSKDLLLRYDDIGWRDMRDFRNILIHEYFGVDFEIVYNTIKDDIPKLKIAIDKMIKEM